MSKTIDHKKSESYLNECMSVHGTNLLPRVWVQQPWDGEHHDVDSEPMQQNAVHGVEHLFGTQREKYNNRDLFASACLSKDQ